MHDLVETGRKIFDAITKQKPADAGDLALGIQRIIEELRANPDQFKDKLDHLEGLFKELVYGEAYELREEKAPQTQQDVTPIQKNFNFPIVSGIVSMGALHGGIPPTKQKTRIEEIEDQALRAKELEMMKAYEDDFSIPRGGGEFGL
tara:strand:+ start:697 stop:1137 length:441 start_codon:yes stop_codon:yes gene_type:complete